MNRYLGILDISNLIHRFIYSYIYNDNLKLEYIRVLNSNNIKLDEISVENIKTVLITHLGYKTGMQVLDDLHMRVFKQNYASTLRMIASHIDNKISEIYMILELTHLILAWDEINNSNFRKVYDINYKANRGAKSDLFLEFKQVVYDSLKNTYCFLSKNTCEADDIIKTCVDDLKDEFDKIYVISADKDLLCLQEDNKVSIYRIIKTGFELLDTREQVKDKVGVYPNEMLMYLSLVGDSVDNITGVKGIGPKNAIKVIEYYNDIDTLRSDIELNRLNKNIPHGIRSKLMTSLRDLLVSSCLVELRNVKFEDELKDIDRFKL